MKLRLQPHDKSLKLVSEFMHKGKAHAQEAIAKRHEAELNEIHEGEEHERRESQDEGEKVVRSEELPQNNELSLDGENKGSEMVES